MKKVLLGLILITAIIFALAGCSQTVSRVNEWKEESSANAVKADQTMVQMVIRQLYVEDPISYPPTKERINSKLGDKTVEKMNLDVRFEDKKVTIVNLNKSVNAPDMTFNIDE